MNRRHLIASAPAAAFAVSLPGAAQADTPDPVIPVYERWLAARADWKRHKDVPGNENWDAPESLEAEARENAAFGEMLDMTPASMAGIAALAHVLWDLDGPVADTDAPEPNAKLMLGILRATIGAEKARELIG